MGPDERRRLIEQAVTAARRARSADDYEEVWTPLRAVADSGVDAAEPALEMIASPDAAIRATGCDLVGLVCNRFEVPRARAAAALLDLAEEETDDEVLWSVARALGATTDPDALPTLIKLARHDDPDIRFQAAVSLPSTMRERSYLEGLQALIDLTHDEDPDVRNWATFGLGRQLDFDSPTVRDALWARVSDESRDVREEAIAGLARRRDRRALTMVADLLATGDVPTWLFDAAASLADASLVTALLEYRADDAQVDRALVWCDPERRARRDGSVAALAEDTQRLLDDQMHGAVVVTWCDLFDVDILLSVQFAGEERMGSAEAILAAGGGEPSVAASLWVDRIGMPPWPRSDQT